MVDMILISDTNYNDAGIRYIRDAIEETVTRLGGSVKCSTDSIRSSLEIKLDEASVKFIRPSVEDKIADVIAVNYKYGFFKKNIRTSGLNELEYELLLSAIISADIDEDKKYIRSKIKNAQSYSIDGVYNFTMKALKEKWTEIVGFIPPFFIKDQLKEFVAYLVKDKAGVRVYVDEGKVYDKHFNKLSRCRLTSNDDDARIIREIILSASGEVELSGPLPETDEFYLKQFFGDKIFFRKTYFS